MLLPQQADPAFPPPAKTGNRAQHRGLAASRRAQQRHKFTFGHGQRKIGHNHLVAIADTKLADLQYRIGQ